MDATSPVHGGAGAAEGAAGREVGPSRRGLLGAAALMPFAAGLGGSLPASAAAGAAAKAVSKYTVSYVPFQSIAPSYLTLTESWTAVGMDDKERVYIAWTGKRTDGRQDTALFRYTPATGARKFLGTFIDVATKQNNIAPGEEIPKGHTHIVQVGRKMYLGSQGFHDFKGSIDALPGYRGAHLFSYDIDTGRMDDVTRTLPGGVLIEHQGIIALNYSPEHHLLVGLAHPLGDIVLFDLATQKVRKVVPGIPWALNHVVSREIVVTRKGKVYTYRGGETPDTHDTKNEVWVYDIAKGTMKSTGQRLDGGFWNGQAVTASRDKIYLNTCLGELYSLDVASGRFTKLGPFITPADYNAKEKYRVRYHYGISLTPDERTLVGAPYLERTVKTTGSLSHATRLTRYDIAKKTFTADQDLTVAVFTGSNNHDRKGVIYQSAFDWDRNCNLAVLRPRGR